MIHSIKRLEPQLIEIVKEDGTHHESKSISSWLNQLLLWEGSTLAARQFTGRRILQNGYKTPILIHEECLLLVMVGVRSTQAFFLNYHAIRTIHLLDHYLSRVYFHQSTYTVDVSTVVLQKQIRLAKELLQIIKKKKMLT